MKFNHNILSEEDYKFFTQTVGKEPGVRGIYPRFPDEVIRRRDNEPYIYRWHVIPRNPTANVYLHIQIASDEGPLHDHPWDNVSVILSGGYDEENGRPYEYEDGDGFINPPAIFRGQTLCLRKGDVRFRRAEDAHRLILPPDIPYTMTMFTTGPKRRDWGFWIDDRKWVKWDEMP